MSDGKDQVFFCIPLQSKKTSTNWGQVCTLLNQTLKSLENQTDRRFSVLLACHEEPPLDSFSFQVKILKANWEPGFENNERLQDKRFKRRMLFREVGRLRGGYVMALDADDLVSNKLVSYVLSDRDPNGYIIEQGYAYDVRARKIAPIPGAWQKTFDTVCGSCAVIRLGPTDLPDIDDGNQDKIFYQLKNHSDWKNVMAAAGRPLKPLPFPAAIYMLNHNNNLHFMIAPNRIENVPYQIEKNKVRLTPELIEEFSIPQ